MSVILAALLSQSIVPQAELPRSDADPCEGLEAQRPRPDGRLMSIEDLVEIADIGRSDPNETASAFGVSPDGKRIAFQLRRANSETNSYCLKLLVMPLKGKGEPVELDRDRHFIRDDFALRDFASVAAGWAKVITPAGLLTGQ